MDTNEKTHLTSLVIKENVKHPDTLWLKPSEVSKLIGLDEKWLAAAREGRKGIIGPHFIKLGTGKTSPIRYPLAELLKWMESIPMFVSHNYPYPSYSSFLTLSSPKELWPFTLFEDGTFDEIFKSMNIGRFDMEYQTRQIICLAKSALLLTVKNSK